MDCATCDESCMLLTSTVLDWSTLVTDRLTDRRTNGRAIAYRERSYILLHAKNLKEYWLNRLLSDVQKYLIHWQTYTYHHLAA